MNRYLPAIICILSATLNIPGMLADKWFSSAAFCFCMLCACGCLMFGRD